MITAPYRFPFDHHTTWNKVGGSGWDDPVWPFHPYYAYDFGFPVGHPIRAARSGTVIAAASTRVEGVNVEEGAGGGNFAFVRHFDGTVASYAHMHTNKVFVQPGAWVHQGQVIGQAGNTGQSSDSHLHFQVMLYANSETDTGPSLPVLFEDARRPSWRPVAGEEIQAHNTVLRQENWRWCRKCGCLFFGGSAAPTGPIGRCQAGGGHDPSQSGCYTLPLSATISVLPIKTQGQWRFCRKCHVLFFSGNPGSKCPAGAGHDGTGSGEYFVSFSASFNPGQEGWRWCSKCGTLFFGASPESACSAGGTHSSAGSGSYTLHQVAELNFAQSGWRRCQKCAGLVYAANPGSVCPKDRQAHDTSPGDTYTLILEPAPVAGQKGWRWCSRCQGLFFGGNGGSSCPAGGSHAATGSSRYQLYLDAPKAPGKPGWRWCRRCQALFLGNGATSSCPANGQPHDASGSGDYTITDRG